MKVTDKRRRAARWLTGDGIEIGAVHNPLSVPTGVSVRYVDRVQESDLRRQYPELLGEALVPIDLIGDAQDLSVLADDSVDFVIANHLVEHLEDPIRGLSEMLRVVRPGGVLYLALPDPRTTFDRNRSITTVEHVLAEYHLGTAGTREAHYAEWVENAEPLIDWMTEAQVGGGAARVAELMANDYSIHFHVWRPDDFIEVLVAARREAGFEAEMVEFLPCDPGNDDEYILILHKPHGALPAAAPPAPPVVEVDVDAEGLAWRDRALACEARLQSAEAALAAITRSRSWRLTRPLRAARSLANPSAGQDDLRA